MVARANASYPYKFYCVRVATALFTVFDLSLIFAIHPTGNFSLLSTPSLTWLLRSPKPLTFFLNNDTLADQIFGDRAKRKFPDLKLHS
ncbi:MAG: hypothetical protein V7K27_23225 [Nostoc sp.]|uniref:hypothetical protein n=1 Tax=Nostoc sp. TaxID=1180 RepID=UPI002FF5C5F6